MISIKKISSNEVEMAVELFDKYRMFYRQTSNVSAARAFLEERLSQNESVIFIAFHNEIPVGLCQLYPIFSSVSMQRTWLLNDLFVDEAARGKGVAALLLQAAKEYGINTNAKWFLLQTGADNVTAQSVYEKNGWQKISDFFYELPLVNID
jgi:GNAT superfamily N-acetyltransferase